MVKHFLPRTERRSIRDMNFIDFYEYVSEVCYNKSGQRQIVRRQHKKNLVITTYPDYSAAEDSPLYYLHCMYSLRKYKAVQSSEDLLLPSCVNRQKPTESDWIESWKSFKIENKDSNNWTIYRAIQNEEHYQLAATGLPVKRIIEDVVENEQEEDDIDFNEDHDIEVEEEEDCIGLMNLHTDSQR